MTSHASDVIGLRVSRETFDKLALFADLFTKWAKTINLVAPSTKSDLWTRHIADSAQLLRIVPEPLTWIDLGSGGGFPGIITAILLTEANSGWVHLVESNQKKAAFLRVALQQTQARGSVHVSRIEDAPRAIPTCDAISARAVADLSTLARLCEPWMLETEARAYFHKGRDYQLEVDKARGAFDFDLLKHQSSVEPDSVILEISRLRQLSKGAGAVHVAR
jgi:16S rRNA (guanine527-N7)-methyltransferase